MSSTTKLLAEFQLDEQGKPVFASGAGKKHYRIDLFVVDSPPEAYCVTYELDRCCSRSHSRSRKVRQAKHRRTKTLQAPVRRRFA